jgi:hypothetical protein
MFGEKKGKKKNVSRLAGILYVQGERNLLSLVCSALAVKDGSEVLKKEVGMRDWKRDVTPLNTPSPHEFFLYFDGEKE